MRISDWSSDVCSSDLLARRSIRTRCRLVHATLQGLPRPSHLRRRISSASAERHGSRRRQDGRSEERRVGKSVSVRVDLGGRRILKKKKKKCRSRNMQIKQACINKKHTQEKKYE